MLAKPAPRGRRFASSPVREIRALRTVALTVTSISGASRRADSTVCAHERFPTYGETPQGPGGARTQECMRQYTNERHAPAMCAGPGILASYQVCACVVTPLAARADPSSCVPTRGRFRRPLLELHQHTLQRCGRLRVDARRRYPGLPPRHPTGAYQAHLPKRARGARAAPDCSSRS